MRRADRLFQIVEYLKARRQAVTAEKIAAEFEVSVRTIYRDISDLKNSGVAILGEAGVGYMLDRDYLVRPLTFGIEELDALNLGAQMVESWGDAELAKSARRARDKIISVLPNELRQRANDLYLFSLPSQNRPVIKIDFVTLRRAIRSHKRLEFRYIKEGTDVSSRCVRPLCLAFFGSVWVLLGWCELRGDFRNFRLDRISDLVVSDETYPIEKGKRLQDYLALEKIST